MSDTPTAKVTVTNLTAWQPTSEDFTKLCQWVLAADQQARYVCIMATGNIYAGRQTGKQFMRCVGNLKDFIATNQ